MIARPGLALLVLDAGELSTWAQRSHRQLHHADALRWLAAKRAARLYCQQVLNERY